MPVRIDKQYRREMIKKSAEEIEVGKLLAMDDHEYQRFIDNLEATADTERQLNRNCFTTIEEDWAPRVLP